MASNLVKLSCANASWSDSTIVCKKGPHREVQSAIAERIARNAERVMNNDLPVDAMKFLQSFNRCVSWRFGKGLRAYGKVKVSQDRYVVQCGEGLGAGTDFRYFVRCDRGSSRKITCAARAER